ncbi:serine/threonine-protein kinase plk4 [Plakobranchus ocellatus]|uniref:Serine/threonine-protein kinase PLK4 n=1 Tax=Plakobranchus ocellatus TaxID=259542 RepID=A0AAV3YSJ9_9GAST|nr:serine/threonine-protein kinase plk4 [Plakobranchus ocellatus]
MKGYTEGIEDYQVLNLLGKGGFACVYRACSNKTGMEVAVKMLYNFFEDSNYVYLVLEMCHNGELQRYLRTQAQPFTEETARRIMRQIVEGILYLHSHGILHRDLSLSNLLLTKDNDVKIADFGLATQLQGPEEKHFTMCGTPNYISPEIAMRSAHGLEADVWSLGCMLYTLLVGQAPFDTNAVKSTLNRVILAEYHLPDSLSPAARDLIQALLKKNPKDRLPLREILTHPFMTMKSSNRKMIQKMSEMSMDSGRGTLAYAKYSVDTDSSVVNATNAKCASVKATHQTNRAYQVQRNTHSQPESQKHIDEECPQHALSKASLSYISMHSGSSMEARIVASGAFHRDPSSPPVRERDSQTEEELQRTKEAMIAGRDDDQQNQTHSHQAEAGRYYDHRKGQVMANNTQQITHQPPTSAPYEKYDPKGGGFKGQQKPPPPFDPSKYSDDDRRSQSSLPGHGSWSVSASIHSQGGSLFDYNTSSNPGTSSSNSNNHNSVPLPTNGSHLHQTQTGIMDSNIVNQFQAQPQGSSFPQHQPNERSCGGAPPPSVLPVAPSRPQRPHHHPGSLSSGQSESDFSLNSTRKVLDFECDSKLSSVHDKQGRQQLTNPENRQTRELLAKVQNYLGQHCFPAQAVGGEEGKSKRLPSGIPRDLPVQFSSPESTHRAVRLTEGELERCLPGQEKFKKYETNLCSPQSDGTHGSDKNIRGGSNDGRDGDQRCPFAPLNTERLRPIRQRTKNVVVHILENGDVCVEFIKRKGQEDLVMEVLYISGNGQQMNTFQPNEGRGITVSEQPQPMPDTCKKFDFSSIPQKYIKKYQYAARFVTLIQSKTPKVTVYTRKAKCMLMENRPDPDFTAEFYDGSKFSSGAKGIKIVERDGTSLTLESTEVNSRLSSDTKDMLAYVKQCRQQCVQLEAVISSVQFSSTDQLFPVIVGRRPDKSNIDRSGSSTDSNQSVNGGGNVHVSTLKSQVQMSAFEGTLLSTTANQTLTVATGRPVAAKPASQCLSSTRSTPSSLSPSSSDSSSRQEKAERHVKGGASGREKSSVAGHRTRNPSVSPSSAPSHVLQQMFVPDIGWASQTATGEVWVRFQDGTQLGVKSTATTVTYVDAAGSLYKYRESDPLPEAVKSKLSKLPAVLEALKSKSQSQMQGPSK